LTRKHAPTRRTTSNRSERGEDQLSVLNEAAFCFTEEHGHGLVYPPTKEGDQRHPEKQELDAQVDRPRLGEEVWVLRGFEEMSQAGTDEEHDGDDAIGGEGHDGEKNDAEPPMIRG
jgi:hypothetical protein